jgi:Protein of unknown function (DUF2846)
MINRVLVLAFMAGSLAACASGPPKPAATPAVAAAPASAPAAASTPAADIPPPPAGAATVVFFRPWKFVGGGVGFIVREGTAELGKLRAGKYFVLHVAPGKHTYTVHSEATDNLTIDADAGETYYIEGEIGVGVLVGHPHIKPSEKPAFDEVRNKLTEVPPMAK